MISVVITTFNRRSFLREATLSVFKQDFNDKEIIIVDDGSTDKSYETVRDLPVQYVWKPNGGISSARNRGIEMAKGDYIAFLDSDDIWKKRKLSIQLEQMENRGYPVSYTDEIWIRNGKRINQKLRHRKYTGNIFEHCLPLCIISPSSVVLKREIFDDVGVFDESLPVCEDYDMWLRVAARYPVLFIDKLLIIKRGGHEDQLSRRYEAMDRFRIKSLVKIIDSGMLNETKRRRALEVLENKCSVYMSGAAKRGKHDEVEQYRKLLLRFIEKTC